MGPVLILATLFNFVEKCSGTSGGICKEDKGIGCIMLGGQVIGSTGKSKGLSSRCFWGELSLLPSGTCAVRSCLSVDSLSFAWESSCNSSDRTSLFSAFCHSFSFWAAMSSLSSMLESLLFFQKSSSWTGLTVSAILFNLSRSSSLVSGFRGAVSSVTCDTCVRSRPVLFSVKGSS